MPISWTELAVYTLKELMDNFWELKEVSLNYINKNPTLQDKTIETAKTVIDYYNGVRHKLNRLKIEIYNYNKRLGIYYNLEKSKKISKQKNKGFLFMIILQKK